jgi:hypothetical protein
MGWTTPQIEYKEIIFWESIFLHLKEMERQCTGFQHTRNHDLEA